MSIWSGQISKIFSLNSVSYRGGGGGGGGALGYPPQTSDLPPPQTHFFTQTF